MPERRQEKGRYAGADFFNMFTFPLVAGNPATALSSPDNIVISEKLAHQWLTLQPYKDMYLYSKFTKGIPDGGRIDYVRLFSLVAGFILLIACVNFINLA